MRKKLGLALFRFIANGLLVLLTLKQGSPHGVLEFSWHDGDGVFLFVVAANLILLFREMASNPQETSSVFLYFQTVGDVVLASCLVFVTGGIESPFTFVYSISVVAAAIVLGNGGAFLTAVLASLSYMGLTWAMWLEVLQGPYEQAPLSWQSVAYFWSIHVLAQVLIAALASYLARQVSMTGVQLQAREADLRVLSELQNQIVRSMPSGLLTCDAEGRLTFMNPAAEAILGISSREAPVLNVQDVLPASQFLPVQKRTEVQVETQQGRRILGLTATPLENTPGARLIVFQDLTGLRATEDALRRSDHLASLGKMSAQLAHEIRNPLAAMRGAAQMIASETGLSSPLVRLANIMVRESDRLSALVEDFLRFARPPPPSRVPINVAQLVRETVEMLSADPLVATISLESELEEVQAEVDPDQLRQALINMLRNAFDAVGDRGKVRVSVRRMGEQVRISVWDSAGSIPSQDLERIFDPFYTTRDSGTGLGLSTTHSIIGAHGGRILVTSTPKLGTEFVIDLPLRSEVSHAHLGG